jgi:hypothetical protein
VGAGQSLFSGPGLFTHSASTKKDGLIARLFVEIVPLVVRTLSFAAANAA